MCDFFAQNDFPRKCLVHVHIVSIFPSHLSAHRQCQISKEMSELQRRLEVVPRFTTIVKAFLRMLSLRRNSELLPVLWKVPEREKIECKKSEDSKLFDGISINSSSNAGKFCLP